MNKHLHKIIFNKKRGQMVVVSENTIREGKSTQDSSTNFASVMGNIVAGIPMLAGCVLLFSSIGLAHAQIVADKAAPANQRPTVLKNAAGAPLINIQTPSAKGLSHNRYTQFDVDSKGAVLNNSRTANPYLGRGSAKIILNEIRSTAPSKLNGIISVEGSKADVIIANPIGIQINGGGFKNVRRGILTTGIPVIKDGGIHQLDIRQGQVAVGANGWKDIATNYTEILSRAAAIQGKIQTNNLIVSTGPQKIAYESGEITAGVAKGNKPTIAIDTAALGSMYAGSITLIANEQGIGVKNAGTLQATRQFVLNSAGRIENRGNIQTAAESTDQAQTYLSIEANGKGSAGAIISDGGKIESKGVLILESTEDIGLRNNATVRNTASNTSIILDAGRNLVIESKATVHNTQGSADLLAGGRTVIKDATIQAGTLVYNSSKGNAELGNNTRITGTDYRIV